MTTHLKTGDVVSIFEDPHTGQKLEGKAKLIKHIPSPENDGLEFWMVKFDDDSGNYPRWVQ